MQTYLYFLALTSYGYGRLTKKLIKELENNLSLKYFMLTYDDRCEIVKQYFNN